MLQLSSVRTILILKMGRFSKRRITNQDKMCLEAWTNLRVTLVIIYQINVCDTFAETLNNIIFWKIKWFILFNVFVKPFLIHVSLTFKVTSTRGLILVPVWQTKRGAEILHFANNVFLLKVYFSINIDDLLYTSLHVLRNTLLFQYHKHWLRYQTDFFNHFVLCVLPNNLILKIWIQ